MLALDRFAGLPAPAPGDWLAEHKEPGQTLGQFIASGPNRSEGQRKVVYLVPLGALPAAADAQVLREFTEIFYGLETRLLPGLKLAGLHVTERVHFGNRQLLSTDILERLAKRLPDDAYAAIAITGIDLYPEPDWNFVFGQASLSERVGVYSLARYDPAFHGETLAEPERSRKMLRRSLKVLVHELGHMFGIAHCTAFHCVMNGSNHLAETDAQPLYLGPVCARKVAWSTGVELVERYRRLHAFYGRHGLVPERAFAAGQLAAARGVPGATLER